MLFVRGINGKVKLNPAVKLWGSLLLLLVLAAGGVVHWFFEFRDEVEGCRARGGVWIGGALRTSYCEDDPKHGADW
jgi:hypothetical protein